MSMAASAATFRILTQSFRLGVGDCDPAHQLSHELRFARAVNQPAPRGEETQC
jgi:hypothetical protein